jgi:hypothetical protein
MKLQILANCRAAGSHLSMGEVADLPQGIANELLSLGLAAIAPEPETAPVCEPKPRRTKTPIPTPED